MNKAIQEKAYFQSICQLNENGYNAKRTKVQLTLILAENENDANDNDAHFTALEGI